MVDHVVFIHWYTFVNFCSMLLMCPDSGLPLIERILIDYHIYTVSQKKTSPTFLAITRESIDGFL